MWGRVASRRVFTRALPRFGSPPAPLSPECRAEWHSPRSLLRPRLVTRCTAFLLPFWQRFDVKSRVLLLVHQYRKEASAFGSPGPTAIDAAITPLYVTAIDCSSATESCILRRRARRGVAVSVMLCDCPGANLGCLTNATRQLRHRFLNPAIVQLHDNKGSSFL